MMGDDLHRRAVALIRDSVGSMLDELASVVEAARSGSMRVNTTADQRKAVLALVGMARTAVEHPHVRLVTGRVRLASEPELLDAAVALRAFTEHCVAESQRLAAIEGDDDAVAAAIDRLGDDPVADLADRLIEEHASR